MKATIDIKTPSGQSLEGFPTEFWEDAFGDITIMLSNGYVIIKDTVKLCKHRPKLNVGDTITIRIKE